MTISCRIYDVMVGIYPADFRHAYGEEMKLIFRDQLQAACDSRDRIELLRVWLCVLKELFTVGLPMRMSDPVVMATGLAASTTPIVFLSLLWALLHAKSLNEIVRKVFGG
jgi:hypothetical protein